VNHKPTQLYKYQKEGVLHLERCNGRTLLADEQGLGKTIQTLFALRRNLNWLPALVVCPASVKYNWQYEAHKHVRLRASVCEGRKHPQPNHHQMVSRAPITIINYDILKNWLPYLKRIGFRTIIFDECQFLSNPGALRTKAAKSISTTVPRIMALSGTPLTNRPIELFPTLNILWPATYNSKWSFAQKFCAPKKTHWGWDLKGSANLDVLHAQLKRRGMIRRLKTDVLKDLPDKVRQVHHCELSDPEQYEEASSDFLGWLKKTATHKVRSASKAEELTKIGYLLRLIGELKLPSVIDWATNFLEQSDEKLIIFAVHKKIIKSLKENIKVKSVVVDGSVTGKKRQLAVQQFQKDKKTRLFIGNIRAAGVGITLTAASTVAFAELYWRPGDHSQAEDRPHRIGQESTVWINYLVAGNTFEDRLCQILQSKQKVISEVLDGNGSAQNLDLYEELLKVLKAEK